MRGNLDISSFNINMDVRVHFKSRSDLFYGADNKPALVLFNLDIGMCQVGYAQSWDGGVSFAWSITGSYAIRESKEGLQYFDHNSMGWKFFDDMVQEAYAQYALEKEIK